MKRLAQAWLVIWFSAALLSQLLGRMDGDLSRTLMLPRISLEYGWRALAGFDPFGKALLPILFQASLTSSLFAAFAVTVACSGAICAGSAIALAPNSLRFALLRGLEILLAFPSLLLALAWAAIRGPGWSTLFVSLLLGTLPPLTRLVYVRTRELMAEEYVLAARSVGAGPIRLAARHLAPALAELCWIKVPVLFSQALLAEATLSYLGVGAPIGEDTWGSLLAAGKDYLFEAPHLAISAGLPLILTVLAVQTLARRTKA